MERWIRAQLSILLLGLVGPVGGETYQLSADYGALDGFPLQKSQFGMSYVGSSAEDMENVYEILKARNTRNNDKRLRGTWTGWDKDGNPIYKRNERVSTLLENAGRHGAVGGANLQGPYEHLAVEDYRTSSQIENRWDWEAYSQHSVQYYQHLRALVDVTSASGYPFVFGIGHEANNDANLDTLGLGEGCVDGIAFMGNLNDFHELALVNKDKKAGDVIQATNYFNWYRLTMDGLLRAHGDRRKFLVSAAQPHTGPTAIPYFMKTFKDLVDEQPASFLPDFIGSHSRWNIPGDERFFKSIVWPSRKLFADPAWMAIPVQCNEFGIYDFDTKYRKSVLGAVRLLNNFEQILESPDVGYVNIIYNTRFAEDDMLHPAFHAFRFYQEMSHSRTRIEGQMPQDLHVLSSRSDIHQTAMIWRDGSGEGEDTVEFTFLKADLEWDIARASLYLISNDNPEADMSSARDAEDFGFAKYMVKGFPKIIHGHAELENFSFDEINMPPASIAMVLLERVEENGKPIPDPALSCAGPAGALYIKSWQWTARDGQGGVDPSWGFFDTRTWTLFAGVDELKGPSGSVSACYLDKARVKRGMAGVEFASAYSSICLEVDVETGDLNPDGRDYASIGAIRIDFFNGSSLEYDAAMVLAGNRFPELEDYTADNVPWGYGGLNPEILPQSVKLGQIEDNGRSNLELDDLYTQLTGKANAEDFVAGGRRVIISAWVENVEAGMVVRIGDGITHNSTSRR